MTPLPAIGAEGLGANWLAFRARKKQSVAWRSPSHEEIDRIESDPDLRVYADVLWALADRDDEIWILMERDWFGWPDPPRYLFVVRDGEGRERCAYDFDTLPRAWSVPATRPIPPLLDS